MANKLGTKQTCPECEAKFYDLNKRPAECPKCGASFDPAEVAEKVKKVKAKAKAKKKPAPEDDEDIEDKADTSPDEDEEPEDETKELSLGDDEIAIEGGDDDDSAPGDTNKVPAGFTEEGVDDDEIDEEDIDIEGVDIDVDVESENKLGEPDAD